MHQSYCSHRHEDLRRGSGVYLEKDMKWEDILAVKNALYRVEAAESDGQLFECAANPNKLTCHCRRFCHENFCKHVCACNHMSELEKPRGERNQLLNTARWVIPLDRHKSGEADSLEHKRGGGGGYAMKTNCYLKAGKPKPSSRKRKASPAAGRRSANARRFNGKHDGLEEEVGHGQGGGVAVHALTASEIQALREEAIARHVAQEEADTAARKKALEDATRKARDIEREHKAKAAQECQAAKRAAKMDRKARDERVRNRSVERQERNEQEELLRQGDLQQDRSNVTRARPLAEDHLGAESSNCSARPLAAGRYPEWQQNIQR